MTNVFKHAYIQEDTFYPLYERNSPSGSSPAARAEQPAQANGQANGKANGKPNGHMIVEDAKAEAYKIIVAAREQASSILAAAEQQAEEKLMVAQKKGYETGLEQGRQQALQQAEAVLQEIQQLLSDIQQHREQLLKENTETIKALVLEVAKKVILTELDNNSDALLRMIHNAVQECTRKDWVKVYVSDQQYELVMARSDQLHSMIKGASFIEIVPVSGAPKGTCVVETPSGIADASVNLQLDNIREAFARAEQSA